MVMITTGFLSAGLEFWADEDAGSILACRPFSKGRLEVVSGGCARGLLRREEV